MEFIGLMNIEYIELLGLKQSNTNELFLNISRSKLSDRTEEVEINGHIIKSVRKIVTDKKHPIINIYFETYITYSVRNESFTSWDDYEVFEGKTFRVYKKSRFLDYIKSSTFALDACGDVYPPLVHYGIVCQNHIVDIVSYSTPIITESSL